LLVVDDEEAHIEAIRRSFAGHLEVDVQVAHTLEEYRVCIADQFPDIVLIDLNLPDGRAVEILTAPAEDAPFPILVMTAFGNQEIVVEVMKAGALDYVVKSPTGFNILPRTVEHALREWKLLQKHKRAEAVLKESEISLRESEILAGFGNYSLDIPTRVWSSSEGLNMVFGIDKAYERTLAGWLALIHPDDRNTINDYFWNEVLGKRQCFNKEYRVIRLDNKTERWVHGIGRLEFDARDQPVKMRGTIQDITKRRASEQQLRHLSRAVEQSPAAIIITDAEGNMEYVNPKFTALTGYSSEESIGKNPRILKSGETSSETYKALWNTIKSGGEWRGEFHNRKKNGELFWESASISSITDERGKITHFLAVKEDISEHKRLNEQFLRAQRIENIGTLASGVAHDLNNILAPIMMASSMLSEDIPKETHDTLVTTIQEAAERGADIVKQVLTFARGVEGRKTTLRPELLVGQIMRILRETFPKSIAFSTSMPKDLWSVSGDVTQLHQVLLNLCVNARDAMMPDGGTLAVSAENIEIDENYAATAQDAKPGRFVVLKVIDSGCGIPPAIIDKIFDPFFTTKDPGKGTGLGLSTVMGIVRSHGGFVEVNSQKAGGSIFRVFIPAVVGGLTELPGDTELPPEPKGRGEAILMVDDEAEILTVAAVVLNKNGYKILTARDGIEALTVYVNNLADINLVLTDIMMPMMDGVNLTRALKKINPGVRIIAASGHAEESREKELITLGICAYLKKPFNNRQLLEAVHGALSQP